MRKIAAGLAAAALLAGAVPMIAAPVATASKICLYGDPAYDNAGCYWCEQQNGMNIEAIQRNCEDVELTPSAPPRQAPEPPSTVPAQAPSNPPPPTQAPATVPAHAPETKPAMVRPPKGLNASSDAIQAARANRASANPANPPSPPTRKDFSQRVQEAVKSHSGNLDVDNGKVGPRHWDYVDNDANGNPVIYNPLNEGMTFRYYYQGNYQEAYVEAGASVSFSFSAAYSGVFPFTAVGDTYLTSGTFYTGSPPPTYQNVSVYLPAYDRTIQVDQVQPLGHDDSQPAGSQDSFMLNGTTFAKGQATNPSDGGAITVAKTQSLPNVGPTDDGKSLIDLTAASQPQSNNAPWLIGTLAAVVLVIAVGLIAWTLIRRKRDAYV
jgi:hypothetical protein